MTWRIYNFSRTVGDSIDHTFQIVVRQSDGTEVPIADDDVATMHIETDPISIITSIDEGLENGTRYFDGDALSAIAAGVYNYEIQIVIGGDDWTPIKGKLEFVTQIA